MANEMKTNRMKLGTAPVIFLIASSVLSYSYHPRQYPNQERSVPRKFGEKFAPGQRRQVLVGPCMGSNLVALVVDILYPVDVGLVIDTSVCKIIRRYKLINPVNSQLFPLRKKVLIFARI